MGGLAHYRRMAQRPCRTNADLKRLWQFLLPETPMPACSSKDGAEEDVREQGQPSKRDDDKKRERLLGRRE